MLEIIIIISLIIALFNILIIRAFRGIENNLKSNNSLCEISVVIPFKNEAKNLPALLESLKSIEYPEDKFEVIFVDDSSNDNSVQLIKNLSKRNIKLVTAHNKKFPGKKGALEIGIKESNYDVIAITDADCIVEKKWLQSISDKTSEGYDVVFGYSPFIKGKNLISEISRYENLKNFILYFASASLGFHYSATARNFAFKKSTYNKINGFQNFSETLSGDDDLFIRECVKRKLKIDYYLYKSSFVFSYPPENFKKYFLIKSRHLKTSHHYLLKHQIVLGVWYSVNLLTVIFLFFAPISFIFFIPFAVKIIFDFVIQTMIKKKIEHDFNLPEIFYLELLYQILVVINFIGSILVKDFWDKS